MNRHERIDNIREPYCLPYDKAIDLAFKLNTGNAPSLEELVDIQEYYIADGNYPAAQEISLIIDQLSNDDPEWHYRVEIDATSGLAKIAVLENGELLGYL